MCTDYCFINILSLCLAVFFSDRLVLSCREKEAEREVIMMESRVFGPKHVETQTCDSLFSVWCYISTGVILLSLVCLWSTSQSTIHSPHTHTNIQLSKASTVFVMPTNM